MPSKSSPIVTVQRMPPKLRLKLANECEPLITRTKPKTLKRDYRFHMVHSKQVDKKHFDQMLQLFQPLMQDMYEKCSWGWNEEEKMSEWKHAKTRVIFVTKKSVGDLQDGCDIIDELPADQDEIVGFMCFRFETGADKDECALYVYELHVRSEFQRQGLGEELMRMAKHIATEFKMDKIMLTVFRCNSQALQFYDKLKFVTDKSSPAKNEADYTILSLKLKY